MESSPRSMKEYLKIAFKGMLMGAADAVPGVSGGTIALITGIYEELIHSLRKCGPQALTLLFRQGPAAAWKHINGAFLLSLLCGVLVSLLSLSQVILYFIETHPIRLWSFFFGLILLAVWSLLRHLKRITFTCAAMVVIGTLLAYWITELSPASFEVKTWYFLFAGMIAICAMILPGISGSFILVLLGMYAPVLLAIRNIELTTLALFASGCVIGLLSFSHVLSWMFKHFKHPTIALLAGFMFGSLNKVWPWKETLTTTVNRHGEIVPLTERNVLPATFETLSGQSSDLTMALILMLCGAIMLVVMESAGQRKKD